MDYNDHNILFRNDLFFIRQRLDNNSVVVWYCNSLYFYFTHFVAWISCGYILKCSYLNKPIPISTIVDSSTYYLIYCICGVFSSCNLSAVVTLVAGRLCTSGLGTKPWSVMWSSQKCQL